MKENQELSRRLRDLLELACDPVGIKYSGERDLTPGSQPAAYACVALRRAFRGKRVSLSRKSMTCPGGLHWLGFIEMEELLVPFLVMLERSFADEDVARAWFRSVPRPPFGRADIVELGPLDSFEERPDLVAVLVAADMAEEILSVLTFDRGDFHLEHRYAATCQGAITNPIVTGKPALCIPDSLARRLARFAAGDVIWSLPFDYAMELAARWPDWEIDTDALLRVILDFTTAQRTGGGEAAPDN